MTDYSYAGFIILKDRPQGLPWESDLLSIPVLAMVNRKSVLTFMLNPSSGADLDVEVTIGDKRVATYNLQGGVNRTVTEVIEPSLLTGHIAIEKTGGQGSVKVSDVVLWFHTDPDRARYPIWTFVAAAAAVEEESFGKYKKRGARFMHKGDHIERIYAKCNVVNPRGDGASPRWNNLQVIFQNKRPGNYIAATLFRVPNSTGGIDDIAFFESIEPFPERVSEIMCKPKIKLI